MSDDREWTPMLGMRRALVRALIRAVIALVLWVGCVWIATPVLNFLNTHWAILAVVSLVLLVPGVAIGHGISRNLTDIAGMAALPLTAMAIALALAVVIIGVRISDSIRDLGAWQAGLTMIATGAAATLWSIRNTVWDT